jgi:hypothetical protein
VTFNGNVSVAQQPQAGPQTTDRPGFIAEHAEAWSDIATRAMDPANTRRNFWIGDPERINGHPKS